MLSKQKKTTGYQDKILAKLLSIISITDSAGKDRTITMNIPGMALTSLGDPDDDPEHDKYTLATGCCVILLGKSMINN